MSISERSSGSADWSGIALPAWSRRAAVSCRSSVTSPSVDNGSSSSCLSAVYVSNWGAVPASAPTSGCFPTERPLRSDTCRLLYGWSHTSSRENACSSSCRNSSTGSPSGETQFSTKGTTKGRLRVAFLMSIKCLDVTREHASAAGYSGPGTYQDVRLYSLRNCEQRACLAVNSRGHILT